MLEECLRFKYLLSLFLMILLFSCTQKRQKREAILFEQYCGSCHIAPGIKELPKDIWERSVLPNMVARMNIDKLYQDPSQVSPGFRPNITLTDWILLKKYIIAMAPDSLKASLKPNTEVLSLFKEKTMVVDSENGSLITFLEHYENGLLWLGDVTGKLQEFDVTTGAAEQLYQGRTPITWYNQLDAFGLITEVGILDPSEQEQGTIYRIKGMDTVSVATKVHRPVHNLVKDLNDDGEMEMVVSEFGNETGRLSLFRKTDSLNYIRTELLNQPGSIRTLAKDMNADGKLDLVTITSQGNESITILYQEENLKFRVERVVEFSPVFGSSWFELVDYNGDGYDDIVTVNGDNADKSYVHKPYHGMRVHLNDGQNNFEEVYFYPLNGATRVLAKDFDQDGDIDFGLIGTFPDYESAPELSFVYLENENAEKFSFKTKVLSKPNEGRWFLMDSGDIDNDGDEDIILSSFTYAFTPVPRHMAQYWAEHNTDLMILENKLNE